MKKLYYLLPCIALAFGTFTSCEDPLLYEPVNELNFDNVTLIPASLDLTVGEFYVSNGRPSTRAAVPGTDEENAIHDFWLFQFNARTGVAVNKPIYYNNAFVSTQNLQNLDINLAKLDENEESVLYVVTNTNDENWIPEGTNPSLQQLKELPLPNPDIIDPANNPGKTWYIPMGGQCKPQIIREYSHVTVPVERMYAKLNIKFKNEKPSTMDNPQPQTYIPSSLELLGVPDYCRVATLHKNDNDPMDMSAITDWGSATAPAVKEAQEIEWTVYVPENLQGKLDATTPMPADGKNGKWKRKLAEAQRPQALSISLYGYYVNEHLAKEPRTLTAYPGQDAELDVNIKRNHIYNITLDITQPDEEPFPSSNCFIVAPGEVCSFYPYYRDETGGDKDAPDDLFDFSSYLNPDPNSDKFISMEGSQNKKGKGFRIIWQTKDCIGDNSNFDKIWIEDLYDKYTNADELKQYERYRINVKTKKQGNALIGAYNEDGKLLWSWHIWVTPEHPEDVENAQPYRTFAFSSAGVNTYRRIPKYRIMNCNLGALKFEPTVDRPDGYHTNQDRFDDGTKLVDGTTNVDMDNTQTYFGMLYQWGRKDPFPPLTRIHVGGQNYEDVNTGHHYGNDGKGDGNAQGYLMKTSSANKDYWKEEGGAYVFHSVDGKNSATVVGGATTRNYVQYTIEHPTVFLCGTKDAYFDNWSESREYCNYPTNDGVHGNYPVEGQGDWIIGANAHRYDLWGATDPDVGDIYVVDDPKYHYNRHYPEQEKKDLYKGGDPAKFTADDGVNPAPDWIRTKLVDNYGKKSIFDPCPYGWRVPSNTLWLGFTESGINPATKHGKPCVDFNAYDIMDHEGKKGMKYYNYGYGMYLYTAAWKEGPYSYFPTQGTRPSNGAGIRNGICGNYHSASCEGNYSNRTHCLHIHDNVYGYFWIDPYTYIDENGVEVTVDGHKEYFWDTYFQLFETLNYFYQIKSQAAPIRCVREKLY